ncbi:GT4_GT28_WabH-like domain containing protein [Candidatus Pelagibacterales bacterium]
MSKINIFILSGGLGNQLFQIAAASNFAFKYKKKVYLDTSQLLFNKNLSSDFLEIIKKLKARNFNLVVTLPWPIKLVISIRKLFQIKIFNFFFNIFLKNVFETEAYKYQLLKDHSSLITIFHGFWQSEKYFFDCKYLFNAVLKDIFKLKNIPSNLKNNEFNNYSKKIAVHFRLTDYSYLPDYGILDINYYLNGIKYIKDKTKNSSVIIFSDDIEKIKSEIKINADYYFNDHGMNPIKILAHMSSCDHFITANSSFSWWAAYIAVNINKIIITPKKWFRTRDFTSDLIPDGWIKIDNKHLLPLTKKVYYVLPNLDVIGAQRTTIDLGKHLLKKDYAVFWMSGGGGGFSQELKKTSIISFEPKLKFIPKIRVIESLLRLLFKVREIDEGIIISVTPFLNRYLCFLKLMGLVKAKLIIEDHAIPQISNRDEFSKGYVRFLYELTVWLYNYADKLRVLSTESKIYYKKKIYSRTKIIYFTNLIDAKRIINLSQKKNNLPKKIKRRLVYIGRFSKQKNLEFIIKASSRILKEYDLEFFIIGYGPQEEYLKSLVSDLGLKKNIFFLKSSEENYSILKSADLFPIASIWEGMVLTIAEAMLLNVPVLSTDFLAGAKFYVGKKNERGWLVPENDILSFETAIEDILLNPKKVNIRTVKAKLFILRNMDVEKNINRYCDIFLNNK